MKAMFLEPYIQVNVGFKLVFFEQTSLGRTSRETHGGAQAVKHMEAHKGSRLL